MKMWCVMYGIIMYDMFLLRSIFMSGWRHLCDVLFVNFYKRVNATVNESFYRLR